MFWVLQHGVPVLVTDGYEPMSEEKVQEHAEMFYHEIYFEAELTTD